MKSKRLAKYLLIALSLSACDQQTAEKPSTGKPGTDYRELRQVLLDDGNIGKNELSLEGDTLSIDTLMFGSVMQILQTAEDLARNNHKLRINGLCMGKCIFLLDAAQRSGVPVCIASGTTVSYVRNDPNLITLEKRYLSKPTLDWLETVSPQTLASNGIHAVWFELEDRYQTCT